MTKMKLLSLMLAASLFFSACSAQSGETSHSSQDTAVSSSGQTAAAEPGASDTQTEAETPSSPAELSQSEMFTDRDKEIGYDEDASVRIQLGGDTAQCDSEAVEISGGTITIQDEGTFILTGTLNGMVIVDAEDTDKLQLVLDGVSIKSESSAALYIRQADKVFVTLAPGSENTLSNGGSYTAIDENNIDAAVFSKEDLTLNGSGSLNIQAAAGHGIVSKDDLVITSGTYQITALSHGLSGKDSVRIAGGSFNIASGKDGIHAENADDASLGFAYLSDGTFVISSEGDGISAGSILQIENGEFQIQSGGGSANAEQSQSSGQQPGRFPVKETETASASEDTVSTKGLKADGDLLINGGNFTIDSADDACHTNGNLTVNEGTFTISTGDDGFHADAGLVIAGGTIEITESYEGIEGQSIEITGGEIRLTASDDGLNAAGGNDQSGFGGRRGDDNFASGSNASIHISGGTLFINASGDGIDSNGSLTVSGGAVYVDGPTGGGDGALDYDGVGTITGGVVVAVGSSQMAQNFGSSSTQGSILVSVGSQEAGSTVTLTDESGQELITFQAAKSFDSVAVSCPEITEGASYTLTAGTSENQITMDSLIYGSGGGMGMGGGGGAGRGDGGERGDRMPMDGTFR
ncbi:carbohydrate-binding domain-containing protein [Cuneatibacter sp. NSJ-177]|uniref:carbohydrate-binding domain-containing protein n=1 Tax=Cuneatibacter sp. NSJ-177 TaxID=2931401 RepID=UPI001FD1AD23|nr:carbohydrate-binding domain-containing protein [Cuneatibacter sp. NSJ-177]MCJ7836849.1 carbohydrate-binding domain-containing protein [Cuneatibacter sp. NSJ-177]